MDTFQEHHHHHHSKTSIPPQFSPLNAEKFDPTVWGPHYWFFLETVAYTYPELPTSVTKRKYYDLIQNMPLFLPNPEIGNRFAGLLDKFPVSPYLDSRDSFLRWVHFIHNKVNVSLGKEEVTLFQALDNYRAHYIPKQIQVSKRFRIQKEYIIASFTLVCFLLIWILYK
jgi:hypothetical protein